MNQGTAQFSCEYWADVFALKLSALGNGAPLSELFDLRCCMWKYMGHMDPRVAAQHDWDATFPLQTSSRSNLIAPEDEVRI